jgi:glucose-1-phosphate thymidylyltransferase
VEFAKSIQPSKRGELEISSINERYLKENLLVTVKLDRGTTWLDTGTIESLHAASTYVKVIEERQGKKISCLEEIAWHKGWITDAELKILSEKLGKNEYAEYLKCLLT